MLPKMAKMAYLWSTVEKILIRTSAKELLSKGNQNPNFEIFVSHFAKILSPISASSTSVFAYWGMLIHNMELFWNKVKTIAITASGVSITF